ncbi:hypothetical protein AAY42_05380 [Flagellimonas eckloniae]|uniref:Uncharacterized protein n=1 Tax=Flagellimonas eckloniae TaxID=346185 RepID=A0A0Q1HDT7_9FLAO|nr:hypothetical protein AAY42_05380 [Allomuricauda eckloniae]
MILLLFLFLALLLCYKLAISNTLDLRKEYLSLKKEERLSEDIPQKLTLLSKKEIYLDSVLQKLDLNNTAMENNLLRVVNKEAAENNIKIIDFNAPHTSDKDNSHVMTYIFTLEGSYVSILRLIHDLETKRNLGSVSHLEFEKKKDYRTKRTYLQTIVFLEQIK